MSGGEQPALSIYETSAYGGEGWSPRRQSTRQEIGLLWHPCGADSEWAPLRAVLLHEPGPELEDIRDPNAVQMLAPIDAGLARRQHRALADAYRAAGVTVHLVAPSQVPPPNLLFAADLFFMTPEGAVVGRPASTVRAGEERWVARRLAELGIPILHTVHGRGTFEGADAMWLDPRTVLLATGIRTNAEGAAQVAGTLRELGVEVIQVGLPYGAMHLMGTLRIVDRDLALAWPGRVPYAAVEALQQRGFRVLFIPDEREAEQGMALNLVALGPRRVLMPAGNPVTRSLYERAGIICHEVEVGELMKAAGAIGCMTGVLEREQVGNG